MTHIEFRVVFGLILGVEFAVIQYISERRDRNPRKDDRFRPLVSPLMLLSFAAVMLPLSLIISWMSPSDMLVHTALTLLQAGAYYMILLALHPLLRRTVSGKGRAVLWLLPNILYIMAYLDIEPNAILRVDRRWVIILLILWTVGAVVAFSWKLEDHLIFRRALLRDACAPPERTSAILRDEERKLKMKREYPLFISPAAKTPLSVGVFDRTMRVILPARAYSDEELTLIFRHELVHIRRQDSATKLFLTVCAALSWFNPFVWLALRRSRDDFESGCDEIVLMGANGETRRRYAELLLDTAADDRGFTTCLSADAKSLRARLKSTVEPKRRLQGDLLTGLLVFLLIVTSRQLALAYDAQSAGALLFRDQPPESISYNDILYEGEDYLPTEYPDGTYEALTEYLAGLRIYKLSADYSDWSEPELHFYCSTPDGWYSLTLREHTLMVLYTDVLTETRTYYIDGDVDWNYLTSILENERTPRH